MTTRLFILTVLVQFLCATASILRFEQGDQCDYKDLHKTCQDVKRCTSEAEKVSKGYRSDICGIKESGLVCCGKQLLDRTSEGDSSEEEEESGATDEVQRTFLGKRRKLFKRETAAPVGQKSKQMCDKYAESVFSYEYPPILLPGTKKLKKDNCGILETPLIVGGEKAKPREFPHMVLIGHSNTDSNNTIAYWQCAGSLISERWVLSAAHCTTTDRGLARWATVGDLKILSNDDEDFSKPEIIKIIERINHPNYKRHENYNDIALYKLAKDVEFNSYVRPICLNTDTGPYSGKAIASGWGNTKWRGQSSQDLLKVTLNLHDMTQCDSQFKKSNKLSLLARIPQGIKPENMVCAWEKDKDTCQGDSGGPLQIKTQNPYCMYSIIGITSFGDECAKDLPGVYTRVSNYLAWIEPKVWPSKS